MSEAWGRSVNGPPRDQVRGPELYRENLFRITGLPVDAAPRIIRRQRKEFEMAALVDDPPPTTRGRFALDPAPDASAVQAAFEGFRDLERRLVDELFWFWRTEPPAPAAPAAADLDIEHDRAVAAHCTALDLEHLGRQRALTAVERRLRDDSWAQAITSWAALIEEPGMWDRLHARIVAIDDPRLTSTTLDELLDELPVRLLTIHAQLALGNLKDAERQRLLMDRFISEVPLDADTVDNALRDVVAPTVRRIEAGCETTRSAAVDDPATACTVGTRLLTELQPALTAIDVILTATHPTARAVRDQVAGALNVCAVQHSNAAGTDLRALAGLEAAIRLLTKAQQLATLVTTKNLTKDNLHGISGQIRALTPVPRFQRGATPSRPPRSTPTRPWAAGSDLPSQDSRTGQEIVAGLRRLRRGPWSYVDQLCHEGRPDLAHDALALWANFMAKDTETARQIATLLMKPAPFVATIRRRPKQSMVLGCGIDFRGRHHLSAGEFVVRQYLILFLVPLIPIAAYLIKVQADDVPRFAGKVPLGMPLRYWRKFLTALFVIVLAVLMFDGSAVVSALGIAVGLRIGFQIYKILTLREKIRLATRP